MLGNLYTGLPYILVKTVTPNLHVGLLSELGGIWAHSVAIILEIINLLNLDIALLTRFLVESGAALSFIWRNIHRQSVTASSQHISTHSVKYYIGSQSVGY